MSNEKTDAWILAWLRFVERYAFLHVDARGASPTEDLSGVRAPRYPRADHPLVGAPVRPPLSCSNGGQAPSVLARRDRPTAFTTGRDHTRSPCAKGGGT